ncbi:hypothetical protein TXYLGN1_03690 [Tepidimicrobium xylanilyticum]|uniref:Uncharacterized protein n=2 Tax=Tepidimicrobium xylanilyticum TaxID=1123352 RepID=A0A1H3B7I8_9FIRM|nr:hypothetical protein SAMN05660923_02177 [Tepidimicrobium xylanilyticum]
MMEYRNGNLLIKSDYEIKPFMEEEADIDLFIPLGNRTLNLYLEGMPQYMDNRIQLLDIRSVLIRFTTEENNNLCTIHFLRNIDLRSTVMNLVFNYENHYINIKEEDYGVQFSIGKKS